MEDNFTIINDKNQNLNSQVIKTNVEFDNFKYNYEILNEK